MLFKNLQLSLFQNSKCFWEGRIVFDNSVKQNAEVPAQRGQAEASKAKENWKDREEEKTKNTVVSIQAADKTKEASAKTLKTAWDNVENNTINQPEIAEKVWKPFEEITVKINNQELIIKLTEELKRDVPATQTETTSPATKQPESSQETVLTADTLKNILHSFDLSITIKGVGDIEIPEATEQQLLTAVIEGKTDFKMSDSAYLKQQFEKSDSAESKILLKGYQEIAQRLEVTEEEKNSMRTAFRTTATYLKTQKIVWKDSILSMFGADVQEKIQTPEWINILDMLAKNESIVNISCRRFDFKEVNGKTVLIDIAKPEKEISDPKEIFAKVLEYYTEIGLKEKLQSISWQGQEEKIENGKKILAELDQTQSKSIENIKTQIAEMQEETAESGNSFFDQIRDLVVLFQEFFSSSLNMDKVEGMWKKLKLDKDKSYTNEFSMSYNEGAEIDAKNVYAVMENKTVTVNRWLNEKEIKITDPEKQLQEIQIGDGKVAFKAVALEGEVAEEQATEKTGWKQQNKPEAKKENNEKEEKKLTFEEILEKDDETKKFKIAEINSHGKLVIGKNWDENIVLEIPEGEIVTDLKINAQWEVELVLNEEELINLDSISKQETKTITFGLNFNKEKNGVDIKHEASNEEFGKKYQLETSKNTIKFTRFSDIIKPS